MKRLQDFFTENHLEEVLQSLGIIPWVCDFRRNVVTSFQGYIDSQFVTGNILHEQNFEELMERIQPEFRDKMLHIYSRVRNGMTSHATIEVQMRMGEQRIPLWVEIHIVTKETDKNGFTIKTAGCATIIQARKEAEEAMLMAQKKAEQANRIKTNFLSNMTHEFRTPLNSILGFSTIMAHSDTLEERMQCLGAVQSSGAVLTQIVDDVLELSRLEANEVELVRNLVDVNCLLEKTVEEMKPMRKLGVQMLFHHTEVPIILHGDEEKIAMVVKQLLDNACKYTERGSIDVYCHKSSEHAVVTIQDTGIGMSADVRHKMFNRFFKANAFIPGTGLGMSVVKELIELWNGTIKVESTPGEGTSVTFTIPLHASFYQNRTQRSMHQF